MASISSPARFRRLRRCGEANHSSHTPSVCQATPLRGSVLIQIWKFSHCGLLPITFPLIPAFSLGRRGCVRLLLDFSGRAVRMQSSIFKRGGKRFSLSPGEGVGGRGKAIKSNPRALYFSFTFKLGALAHIAAAPLIAGQRGRDWSC